MKSSSIPSSNINFAREIRKTRSNIKKELKTGMKTLNDVLKDPDIYDKYIANMSVFDLLSSLQGYGRVSVEKVLKELKINNCKKVGGMGKKQKEKFYKYFGLKEVFNTKKNGRLFIISGPSGAGKSTLITAVLARLDNFLMSVSVTTRPQRKIEAEGKKYSYISEKEFMEMVANNELLEYAQYIDYYYGTPKKFVDTEIKNGNNVILEIDVKGAMQVKERIIDAYMIFIMTPNLEILKERLLKRNTESAVDIAKRLETAKNELEYQKYYDCIIVHNDYNEALLNLMHVLKTQKESKVYDGNL